MSPAAHADHNAPISRGAELGVLRRSLAEARAGRLTVAVVTGEAGIGKSALLRWFLRHHVRDATSVLSTCRNDGVPGSSFATILDAFNLPADARPIAAANTVLQRAVDELVVLVLDDIQEADDSSFNFLTDFLLAMADRAATATARCLVIISGRVPDIYDTSASRLLGRLASVIEPTLLPLSGLDETAATEFLRRFSDTPVQPHRARSLLSRSDGNPLLMRLLAERESTAGELPRAATPMLVNELRDRLNLLGEVERALVDSCAVVGIPIDAAAVAAVTGWNGERPRATISPALKSVLQFVDGNWRFTHEQYRAAALDAIPPEHAADLHRRLAEFYVSLGDDDAILRADHLLSAASFGGDTAWRRRIAERAGDVALDRQAWPRSADAYRTVLEVDEPRDLPPDLLLRIATALMHDNQPALAQPVLEAALQTTISNATVDPASAIAIANASVRNAMSMGAAPTAHTRLRELAADSRVDAAARSAAWVTLADAAYVRRDFADGMRCCAEATQLASASGDTSAPALALYAEGLQELGMLRMRDALRHFTAVPHRGRVSEDDVLASWWKTRAAVAAFHSGALLEAAEYISNACRHGEVHCRAGDRALTETYRAAMAQAIGDLATAAEAGEQAERLFRRSGYPAATAAYPQLVQTHLTAGRREDASEVLVRMAAAGVRAPAWLEDVARHGRFTQPVAFRGDGRPPTPEQLGRLATVVLSATGDSTDLRHALAALQHAFEAGTNWTTGWVACVPRLLAAGSICLGDFEGAARWLHASESVTVDTPLERTETTITWMRLHAAAGRDAAADQAKVRALTSARAAGWLGLGASLTGLTPSTPFDDTRSATDSAVSYRTIVFTDIVGSTNLNVRVGDQRFVAILEQHNTIVRAAAEQHNGIVFHNTGDGYGLWFVAAVDAVACAADVHLQLAQLSAECGATVGVRIGIAFGTPVALDGDLFGVDVVRAARVCALAASGETWVDASTARDCARDRALRLAPLEPVVLKGFRDPESLFVVHFERLAVLEPTPSSTSTEE